MDEISWGGTGDDITIGLISSLEGQQVREATENEIHASLAEKLTAAR